MFKVDQIIYMNNIQINKSKGKRRKTIFSNTHSFQIMTLL